MNTLKLVGNWIWFSSKDPAKVSLTVKSVGGGLVAFLIAGAGIAHLQFSSDALTSAVDSIASVSQDALFVVSSIGVLYGSVRKVWATIKGIHPLQNQ
jgi:hypothetical protein